MKNNTGKILYNLLLLLVGVCLLIGLFINIKAGNGIISIAGCLAIGIGMVTFAVQGFKNLNAK